MEIWFTRPSTWDLWVRGVERCTLWLQKPFYDTTPRGTTRDIAALAHLPTGWRVVDADYGDITGQVSLSAGEVNLAERHRTVAHTLWDALCRSVDGLGADEQGGAARRFERLLDSGVGPLVDEAVMSTFLLELDAPPVLWFEAAWMNGMETQTAAGQWAQKVFALDTEWGVEPDELPPVAHPVIYYRAAASAGVEVAHTPLA